MEKGSTTNRVHTHRCTFSEYLSENLKLIAEKGRNTNRVHDSPMYFFRITFRKNPRFLAEMEHIKWGCQSPTAVLPPNIFQRNKVEFYEITQKLKRLTKTKLSKTGDRISHCGNILWNLRFRKNSSITSIVTNSVSCRCLSPKSYFGKNYSKFLRINPIDKRKTSD